VPESMRVEYSRRAIADLRRIAADYARSGDPAIAERTTCRSAAERSRRSASQHG
jgi:hypothetical protein